MRQSIRAGFFLHRMLISYSSDREYSIACMREYFLSYLYSEDYSLLNIIISGSSRRAQTVFRRPNRRWREEPRPPGRAQVQGGELYLHGLQPGGGGHVRAGQHQRAM